MLYESKHENTFIHTRLLLQLLLSPSPYVHVAQAIADNLFNLAVAQVALDSRLDHRSPLMRGAERAEPSNGGTNSTLHSMEILCIHGACI